MKFKRKLKVSKSGYINRLVQPLPKQPKLVDIIYEDFEGEHVYRCLWMPFTESVRNEMIESSYTIPSVEYLGTCLECLQNHTIGIGFHAWDNNEHEFKYYKILDEKVESWEFIYRHRRF